MILMDDFYLLKSLSKSEHLFSVLKHLYPSWFLFRKKRAYI